MSVITCASCQAGIHEVAARDAPELFEAKEKLTIVSKQLEQLRERHEAAHAAGDAQEVKRIGDSIEKLSLLLGRLRSDIATLRLPKLIEKEGIYQELLKITKYEIEIARSRMQQPRAMA